MLEGRSPCDLTSSQSLSVVAGTTQLLPDAQPPSSWDNPCVASLVGHPVPRLLTRCGWLLVVLVPGAIYYRADTRAEARTARPILGSPLSERCQGWARARCTPAATSWLIKAASE